MGCEYFDNEERQVVFTHYVADKSRPKCTAHDRFAEEEWMNGTNILRVNEEEDGVEGVCWAIYQGSYISVGISIEKSKATKIDDDEEVILLMNKAFKRGGLIIENIFQIVEVL